MASSLSFSAAIGGRGELSSSRPAAIWHLHHGRQQKRCRRRPLHVTAAWFRRGKKRDNPWPRVIKPEDVKKGYCSLLNPFKPLPEPPKPLYLSFELPLLEMEKRIDLMRQVGEKAGRDVSELIAGLENKYQMARRVLYANLAPIQRVKIARHPNRPTTLDHIVNMTDRWVELHGDRAGYDDPAIVAGLGKMNGRTYMFMGHQKGRNTKENIKRNFAMPTPHGYRKALRLMRYADHHGFPIISMVDTPGAFADLKSEELNQGEAIAFNLREMFGLKVPIVSVVIGEGGSGGALAIACCNTLLMLKNAVYYVASPEACAAILWKENKGLDRAQAAANAAERLKVTADELCYLDIADGVIEEPLAGAHTDPLWTSQQIKIAVTKAMEELEKMDVDALLHHRMHKFRKLSGVMESPYIHPEKLLKMKAGESTVAEVFGDPSLNLNILTRSAMKRRAGREVYSTRDIRVNMMREDLMMETANAFAAMGLLKEFNEFQKEGPALLSARRPAAFKKKLETLTKEFEHRLARTGTNYDDLKRKIIQLNLMEGRFHTVSGSGPMRSRIILKRAMTKILILKEAQLNVSKGYIPTEKTIEKLESARIDLQGILGSSINLEDAVTAGTLRKNVEILMEVVKKNPSQAVIQKLCNKIRDSILSPSDVAEIKKAIGRHTARRDSFEKTGQTTRQVAQAGTVMNRTNGIC